MEFLGRRLRIEGACGREIPCPRCLLLHHLISLYADDVVLFLRPVANDIEVLLDILNLFGDASGLPMSVQKSSVLRVQCTEEDMNVTQDNLPCEIHDFPSKYLGIPLSLKKYKRLCRFSLYLLLCWCISSWPLIFYPGQLRRLIKSEDVLAIDLLPWAIKAIDKIRRFFLWRGRKEAKVGHRLVAWAQVQQPKELGGLGISNLQTLGWALTMRWLWLQKINPDRPWTLFPFKFLSEEWNYLNENISSEECPLPETVWKNLPRKVRKKTIELFLPMYFPPSILFKCGWWRISECVVLAYTKYGNY
ncbi:hypothetical protein U9M48_028484 [Paspalum notatum var. saurae]|uniref:Reverse transcriptase domain-containing protein n=1 Tax=Paspalum notatum var. saurae TaxID=547442 RepID=A0AAQ3X084_PASNO